MSSSNPRLSVVVLGASDRPDRYSFKAIQMLREHDHEVHPVSPRNLELPGMHVYPSVTDIEVPIHTITLYVNPRLLETLTDEIISSSPKRVIFNPGTEHPEVAQRFRDEGIQVTEACTLVLLSTNQFEDD